MKKTVLLAAIMLFCSFVAKSQTFWYPATEDMNEIHGGFLCEVRDSVIWVIEPDWGSVGPEYRPTGTVLIPAYLNQTIVNLLGLNSTYANKPVVGIGARALYNCSQITSVHIPVTVTQIDSDAFENCPNISSVGYYGYIINNGAGTAPTRHTATLEKWCNITCSNAGSKPTGYSLYIGGWYDVYAGYGYDTITDLIVPNGLTTIKPYSFSGCSGLTSVSIPASVASIGAGAFRGCSGLTSVSIPANVSSIGAGAFSGCSGLTSVSIPASVASIGEGVFMNCVGLTNANFNAENCPMGAFQGCDHLRTLTIGDMVQHIGGSGFDGCTSLAEVFMKPATPPSVEASSFANNAPGRVFMMTGCSYDNYYDNTSWSPYRNALRDPVIDITVNASSSNEQQGVVVIMTQRNNVVHCDSTAVVRALADNGYHFDHWSDGSTDNPYTIHLTGDTTVIAYFESGNAQGIESSEDGNASIYDTDGQIIVEGADGQTVTLCDISGRTIAVRRDGARLLRFDVPASGVYLVKIGRHAPRKVVVIK